MLLLFLAAWTLMTPFVIWYALRLKRASMDEKFVYIQSYVKGIQVPFADVEAIKVSSWPNMRHVTLKLKTQSDFGNKILFIPRRAVLPKLREQITL